MTRAAGAPIKFSLLLDDKDANQSFKEVNKNLNKMESEAKTAGKSIDNSLEGVGEGADTIASKGAQAAGALSGLGDVVGGPLGAAMTGLGGAMQIAADSGDLLNAAIEGGGKALSKAKDLAGALTKAETYSAAAKKVSAAAQWLLNAAMSANPIGLIIAGITVLVAALVLFFTKTKLGKEIVSKAFAGMKTAAVAVKNFFVKDIPAAFQKVLDKAKAVKDGAVAKFQALVDWIKNLPSKITTAAGDLFHALRDKAGAVKTWVVNKIQSLVEWFKNLPGKIGRAAGDVFSSVRDKASALKTSVTNKIGDIVTGFKNLPGKIYNGIKSGAGKLGQAGGLIISKLAAGLSGAASWAGNIASTIWNALKGFINTNLIDKLNSALDFHISILGKSVGINLPDIPHLARGGITTGPTLALIGDNPGGREAVIPLDKYSMGGTTVIYNYFTIESGIVTDPIEQGRQVKKVLTEFERYGGGR